MTANIIRWESWALSAEADRRFRRIVLFVGIPILILAILISIFQMEVKKTETTTYTGGRSVELVAAQPPGEVAPPEQPKPAEKNSEQPPQKAAPPKPREKPQEKPKEVPQEKPVPPQPTARELAQKTQEMKVIQDQLQDLRDQSLNTLSDQPLVSSTITSKGGVSGGASAESIAQSAAANSGNGIGGYGSVTSTQSGTGLGSRRTGKVQSPLGFGRDVSKAGNNGKVDNGRTVQELQEIFDRNKGALTAIYNRQARENANMGDGKLVVRITIAPDGAVTQCSVVSSSFNDPDFEHKIVQRILLFRFQPKNVPPFTYDSYPIEFHPM